MPPPEAHYLRLDVRACGWDWASFVSFGLCNAQSDIGETFDTFDDALSILGSGSTGYLPRYVYVVAIENEPYVLELKKGYGSTNQAGVASAHKGTGQALLERLKQRLLGNCRKMPQR